MRDDKDRYWDFLDEAMQAAQEGRTDAALTWLDQALEENPAGAEARNGRGEILWDEGKVDEAVYEFERAVEADPKFTTAHLNRAELLIEEFAGYEQAIEHCDRLLAGGDELPRADRAIEAEILYLKSKALFYLDDLDGALFLVRRALRSGGEQSIYRAFEGQILFEKGHFAEARRPLERAVAMDPESSHGVYHLGLVLERTGGDAEEIERCFERADALDPDHYPMPSQIDIKAFERAAEEALNNLPRSIREYVVDVPVLIEDYPSAEMVNEENVSPQILGLFIGIPRTEASASQPAPDMDRVILYKRNLERMCRNEDDLVEQIQITVKHEIGHYLGLSEEDLERLGLG
jgi:predicted Zn-dependent protease with MMP-like domain/Flp pilus assembly protein TadD